MGEFEFMDMMYQKYTCPLEFMSNYINSGQFGYFVSEVIDSANKIKREEAKKEEERKLWELYLHSMSDKSFNDWKNEVYSSSEKPEGHSMTSDQIDATINDARSILKDFNMK